MVLYKRKPVRITPLGNDPEDDAMVWQINETGEVFLTYDEYLERMDFYKTKQFNCEISGRSGLTYFDALKSEANGAHEVEQTFPEALKGPVLRKVQFKTTSRIDNLVDMVFDEFKDNFFPGETVLLTSANGERPHGIIRDKVTHTRNGVPQSQYMVSVSDPPEDRVCEAPDLSRDRKSFNKSVLRYFIKKTVTRDAWNGAPWLVRHNYANKYHIETRVPLELSYDTKLQERKLLQAQKRASVNGEDSSTISLPFGQTGPARLPDLKPDAFKSHKKQYANGHANGGGKAATKAHHGPVPGQFMHLPLPGNPFEMSIRNSQKGLLLMSGRVEPAPVLPPPPPPQKYPVEDLQVPRKKNFAVRPPLQFLSRNFPGSTSTTATATSTATTTPTTTAPTTITPTTTTPPQEPYSDLIEMKSVGPLLETWDTLNVYCEIFKLDSFTFDDYIEAMCVASNDVQVELFDEIHCAVLKVIVDGAGRVQVSLPALEDESDSESEEESDDDAASTNSPDAKPTRATRGSLAKQEAQRLAAEVAAADAEASITHRADEVLEGRDWVAETARRQFANGGWQMIVVGLLHRLARSTDRRRTACEEVLAQLAPPGITNPTAETVCEHYARMDVNYRVQALQIICMLTYETRAFRAYMEECSEGMTQYRKDRIEWQRKRKAALEEIKTLHDKKRELDMADDPPKNDEVKDDGDTKMGDALSDHDTDGDDDGGRRKRSTPAKPLVEKTKREKDVQERREREKAAAQAAAAAAKAATNKSRQQAKLAKEIQRVEDEIKQCEDEVAVIENDLRESDCPRTRVLGKDRFWNRYYWFERNGMPFGGLPNSSTAEADYACGRIWVQGPDDLEREGFIDISPQAQAEYRARFGTTVVERKREEEGGGGVQTAREWGFFAEPEQVDELLAWLDPRGINELKLKKELLNFKERIFKTMQNRKIYLGGEEKKGDEKGDEKKDDDDKEEEVAVKKRTRGRPSAAAALAAATTATPEPEQPAYRCLAWTNLTAVEECGHLHSRQPPPVPARKKGKKREAANEAEPSPARKTRRR